MGKKPEKISPSLAFDMLKIFFPAMETLYATELGGWDVRDQHMICLGYNHKGPIDWAPGQKFYDPAVRYRDPIMPQDANKFCEFSDNGKDWHPYYHSHIERKNLFNRLRGIYQSHTGGVGYEDITGVHWKHARVRTEE